MRKLKEKIKKIPILGKLFIELFFFVKPNRKLGYWIKRYLDSDSSNIVQIGSNDGKTGDPVYDLLRQNTAWKALLVEPVPYLFKRLKANYKNNPRFAFENVAINDGQVQTFYAIKPEASISIPELPHWYDQLGSFHKANILKPFKGQLEPFIEEIELQGITLETLFSKHSLKTVDLLHIDTEGYDWNILSQLNLEKYAPILIIYEHKHMNKVERRQSIEFLSQDYFIFNFGSDYLAIRQNAFKKSDHYLLKQKQVIPTAGL